DQIAYRMLEQDQGAGRDDDEQGKTSPEANRLVPAVTAGGRSALAARPQGVSPLAAFRPGDDEAEDQVGDEQDAAGRQYPMPGGSGDERHVNLADETQEAVIVGGRVAQDRAGAVDIGLP